jgi:hypothetical protein
VQKKEKKTGNLMVDDRGKMALNFDFARSLYSIRNSLERSALDFA